MNNDLEQLARAHLTQPRQFSLPVKRVKVLMVGGPFDGVERDYAAFEWPDGRWAGEIHCPCYDHTSNTGEGFAYYSHLPNTAPYTLTYTGMRAANFKPLTLAFGDV